MSRTTSILIAAVMLLTSAPVFAQDQVDNARSSQLSQESNFFVDDFRTDRGNLTCFDYFRFGSVQADFQPSLEQTVPGASITFSGTVTNNNDYPLVDGTLYVKIFKQDNRFD